jgi:phage regulator Rha-like protein
MSFEKFLTLGNEKVTTTSLKIAEAFSRDHKRVLATVDKIQKMGVVNTRTIAVSKIACLRLTEMGSCCWP